MKIIHMHIKTINEEMANASWNRCIVLRYHIVTTLHESKVFTIFLENSAQLLKNKLKKVCAAWQGVCITFINSGIYVKGSTGDLLGRYYWKTKVP